PENKDCLCLAHDDGLPISDLSAVSEVRVELESYAGYLAASRIAVGEQEYIGALLEQVDQQTEHSTRGELIQLDLRIHRGVYRATDRKSTRLNSSHVSISYA